MVKAECLFTAETALMWTKGEIIGNKEAVVTGAEVDSRLCRTGQLFVALDGERVNGHDFIKKAFENGASGAVVASGWAESAAGEKLIAAIDPKTFIIIVENPLVALQQMAAEYLKSITGPVRIGVTGSNGKTTTKELIASVLSQKYSVVKTEGNYNSEIGLPLTVFNIRNDHDYAVIEMGINRIGEMDILTEILRPDLVVITNIGTAHIGIFKNRETIAYEKRQAVSLFKGSELLFVSEDENFKEFLSDNLKGELILYGRRSFGKSNGNVSCENRGLKGWGIGFNKIKIEFPLIGKHNLKNAFCALSLGLFLGLTDEEMKKGLEKVEPLFGRSEIVDGPVTIIQDCYNSNLESLIESVEFTESLEWVGDKCYVLGDMKELGAESSSMHEALGDAVAQMSAGHIFFFGEDTLSAYKRARATKSSKAVIKPIFLHTDNYESLEASVLSTLKKGDLLLIKGSRSMKLERLIEPVQDKFRGDEC